jgi:Arc/MetJ family transcription regulator
MLSTATALIEATQETLFDDEVMDFAREITHRRQELEVDDFAKAIYLYSTVIASLAVDKAMKVLLTETEVRQLIESMDELEKISNEVLNG